MNQDTVKQILLEAKTVAVVGLSDKPHRTSFKIAQYLKRVGYQVIPVNPMVSEIDGDKSYPNLRAIPDRVDIINVFRRSEFLAELAEEVIAVKPKLFWAQLGVFDKAVGDKLRTAGIEVVMDRCIMVEHRKFF